MFKRMSAFVIGTLLISAAAFAGEPMTAQEKKALLDHLARTSANFRNAVANASEAQWSFKPAADKWSLAECAEHIIASESFIRDAFSPSLKTSASAELLANARKEQQIDKLVVDRSSKFKAPEPLQPSAKFKTAAEALAAWDAERTKTVALVENSGDLRSFAMEHPFAGPLDAYGWVTFISAHTARHTLQIEEVKASENYPAK